METSDIIGMLFHKINLFLEFIWINPIIVALTQSNIPCIRPFLVIRILTFPFAIVIFFKANYREKTIRIILMSSEGHISIIRFFIKGAF